MVLTGVLGLPVRRSVGFRGATLPIVVHTALRSLHQLCIAYLYRERH